MPLAVLKRIFLLIAVSLVATIPAAAQTASAGEARSGPAVKAHKTIFLDSDGNLVSNNEFVDIRMANPSYPDATVVKTLEDGTVEFQLQKIPQEGMPAPALSVTDIHGRKFGSAELAGKVVVLNFWFIGCPPCMAEIPHLNKLREQYASRDDIVFLALTHDDRESVKKFLARKPFNYVIGAESQAIQERFVFAGFPKNIVVGRDGRIVYWRSTVRAWDKFESVIKAELGK